MQLRERKHAAPMAEAPAEEISDDSSADGNIAMAVRRVVRPVRNSRKSTPIRKQRSARETRDVGKVDYKDASSSSSSEDEVEDDIAVPDFDSDLYVPDSNSDGDGKAEKDTRNAGRKYKNKVANGRAANGWVQVKKEPSAGVTNSGRPRRACTAAKLAGKGTAKGTLQKYWCKKVISSASGTDDSASSESEDGTEQAVRSPRYAVTMHGLEVEGAFRPVAKVLKQAEKILAVRNRSSGAAVYCVKEYGRSYRNAVNVTEAVLQKYSPQLLRSFHKRLDALGRVDGHLGTAESGPAFDPQYLIVDRVVALEQRGRTKKVYVKWKGLPYTDATWEIEESMAAEKAALAKFRAFGPSSKPRNISTGFEDGRALREYQKDGVAWLDRNFHLKVNCILADEMGLGKTIQSVAMLENLRYKKRIQGPFLIVAPVSTLGHWQREIESLTDMNCVVYMGSQEDRAIIQQYEFWSPRGNPKFTVLLSSFEIIMKDRSFLAKVSWQYVVVDEAHRLKSKESKTAHALGCMDVRQGGLLLLTGTPIQNNTKELFSLLSFLDPDKFDSEESFMNKYGSIKDIEQVKDLQENVLRPRLLRRMKEDVEKSIPLKEETIIWVELTKDQRAYYRALYENRISDLIKGTQPSNMPNLRNMAMELRKLCNHPFLCDGLEEDFASKHANASSVSNLVQSSGKMVLLNKLLPMLRDSNRRVLIFSQFTIMLDILEDYLSSEGYTFERIDGKIRGSERQAAIDRYSANDCKTFAFLLSTRAGGLGITLTAADTCIIYDSDWNPQNDLQAMARCHRIGQTKDVRIYRLITRNTYEQHLFECSSRKYGLDEAVLGRFAEDQPDFTKNIESLLRHGAYVLKEDGEEDAAAFRAEDIDQILQQRTQKRTIGGRGNNTFSVATFVSLDNATADPSPDFSNVGAEEFWKNLMPEAYEVKEDVESISFEGPRRKRVNYAEKTENSSDDDDDHSRSDDDQSNSDGDQNRTWSVQEVQRVELSILMYGTPQRDELFKDRDSLEVEEVTQAIIELCHYAVMKSAKPDSIIVPPVLPPKAEKALNSPAFMQRLEKNATKYLEIVRERQAIAKALKLDNLWLGLPRSKKLPTWWGEAEDLDLLKGVHMHGHKAFKSIRADASLCFASMIDEYPSDAVLAGRVKRLVRILEDTPSESRNTEKAIVSQALTSVQESPVLKQSNRHKRIFSERPDDIEPCADIITDPSPSADVGSKTSKRIRLSPLPRNVAKVPKPVKAPNPNESIGDKENKAPVVSSSKARKRVSPPTSGKQQQSLLGYFTPRSASLKN
ncbi:chromodomain-helicase-DNA-binding protein 8 [Selaginella moellendorffii]|uniref:chromodomain-helicase-DNA-binding protein 8 n=1 Tax=Selaginella moellendorffii TaxID=88036 RepID=UPI000D1CBEFC|nr:chromodomain-helicase-DNA-binding protein 8 [Selaginella moellendorffii]|eukprot:XP_024535858.1 chromodomain-helicase-DNA-binding protein 8 [Selaginella moellendorffii]